MDLRMSRDTKLPFALFQRFLKIRWRSSRVCVISKRHPPPSGLVFVSTYTFSYTASTCMCRICIFASRCCVGVSVYTRLASNFYFRLDSTPESNLPGIVALDSISIPFTNSIPKTKPRNCCQAIHPARVHVCVLVSCWINWNAKFEFVTNRIPLVQQLFSGLCTLAKNNYITCPPGRSQFFFQLNIYERYAAFLVSDLVFSLSFSSSLQISRDCVAHLNSRCSAALLA